ncbi:MAG: HAD family hydrolase [Thermodesulfobacteriota bacterium]
MLQDSKKSIFFDFGDTLAATTPSYMIRIAMALSAAGYPVSDREFELAYIKTDYEIYMRYKAQEEITPDEYREWFFPILCKYLCLDGDPYEIRSKMRVELKGIKFSRARLPGANELLDFLKGKGYILVVISNNDGKTEEKCEEVGIREYFDMIIDSTNIGLVKPDARIFQFVLEKLKLSNGQARHIGDLYGSDVMGGLNAGIDVIWLNNRDIQKLDGSQIFEFENLSEIKELFE